MRPRPATRAAPAPAPDRPGAASARAVRVVASVAANATLFTALLYYFGLLYTQVFFGYFRVHYTLLDQSVPEVLMRGVDGLLLPLGGAGFGCLLVLGVLRLLRSRLSERSWARLLGVCAPVAAVAGLVLVGTAAFIAVDPAPYREHAGLPGLGLAVGVLLLVSAGRRWGWGGGGPLGPLFGLAEWLVTYLLVAFGLFWAAGDYSGQVGVRKGFETASGLAARPAATLYSARSLAFPPGGVRELACGAPDTAYRYRYTGLKLLLQSGGQYVFVDEGWRPATGTAFVVQRSDALRLEFAPPRTRPAETC